MTPRAFAYVLVVSVLAASPVFCPATARAQDDASVQMARERFQEGVKFYDQKQYDKARAAFLQAYALKKHPAVLLNLAQSELRSNHEADAAKHFAQYIREAGASPAERQEAEKGLAQAKASVAELSVAIDAENADVYVDGNMEGRSPLPGPVYLRPGSHTLEARKDGKVASATVTAIAAQTGSVDLSFAGGSGGTAPATTPPGGAAGGEGNPAAGGGATSPGATGPGGGPNIPPDTGKEKPGFVAWAAQNKVAWVGGGLAVLGLAGGIGFALASKSNYNNADDIRNQILQRAQTDGVKNPCGPPPLLAPTNYTKACGQYQDHVDSGDSQKTLSTVSFVVAGVAVAGTVIYYFIDTGSNKASVSAKSKTRPERGFSAGVVPIVSQTDRGIGFVGAF